MPPGLLPAPFLDRLGECVATYFFGLAGPAADQTPRSGNSCPTNRDKASLSRCRPNYRCGLTSVLGSARLRCDATLPRCREALLRRVCDPLCPSEPRTTGGCCQRRPAAARRERETSDTPHLHGESASRLCDCGGTDFTSGLLNRHAVFDLIATTITQPFCALSRMLLTAEREILLNFDGDVGWRARDD